MDICNIMCQADGIGGLVWPSLCTWCGGCVWLCVAVVAVVQPRWSTLAPPPPRPPAFPVRLRAEVAPGHVAVFPLCIVLFVQTYAPATAASSVKASADTVYVACVVI